ncbi:beta strand repeat-containing protein [Thioalkalivibrio sp. HK1]|uniref:beta strand repeat-containing protein n=1 Tax=Thioalkalivibrio sp. HK1 TaxID=1469245 RepID=UPI0004714FDB|nr:hypothetical protein [Thioalkalivibrio sp. HK1]
MKRIISMALYALVVLPAAVSADSTNPVIKLKSSGAVILSGTTSAGEYSLTMTEGQTVTLTAELGVLGTAGQRRIRFLQNFTTSNPSNTYNPDVHIGTTPASRDQFQDHATNPAQFGYRANNARINFTDSNWNQAVDVNIEAKEDDDAANETFRIQIPTADNNRQYLYINGTITDNDTIGYDITPTGKSLTLNEGSNGTFQVRLATIPSMDVEVSLTKTGTDDVTISPASLDYTTTTWNTYQTVTVTAANDDDAIAETASIALEATGGNYDDVADTFSVSVTETDTRGITLSKTSLDLDEGDTDTFTVKLDSQPSANTTINLARSSLTATAVGLSTSALAFTTSNWSTPQTITVTAIEDADALDSSGSINLTSSGGDYETANISSQITVDVEDNDSIEIVHTSLADIAEGSNQTFNVRLGSMPSGNVTVSLAQTGTSNSDVTFSPSSLTFAPSVWSLNQEVTVSGADDDDGIEDQATIRLTASGGGYNSAPTKDISVTVNDDDTAEMVVSADDVEVEEGSTATFTIRLTTQPSADVTVTLAQSGTAVSEITFTSSYTFTTSNWGTAQTVTISAADDTNTVDESLTINVTAAGGDYAGKTDTVDVDVIDTTVALILDPTSLNLVEGSNGTFDVKLRRQPDQNAQVTLTKASGSSGDVTLDKSTMTFTTTNWNTNQTVTVSAANDADSDDDTATITLQAQSGTVQSTSTLPVSVKDNTPKVVVSKSSLSLNEEGATDTFEVKLKAVQPTANQNVTVTLTSSDDGVTVDTDSTTTGNQDTLTFTNANWDTNRTVTVAAIADHNTIDEDVTIDIEASGGAYDNAADEEVDVSVSDNDTPALTLSATTLMIDEGTMVNIQVNLATQPSGDVTVSMVSSNSDVTLDTDPNTDGDQSTLTFTSSNWNTQQDVRVTAAHDGEATDDPATITVSASGEEYDNLADIDISITVDDDDSAGLTISVLERLVEGESQTFKVKLSSDPLSQVTVDLAQSGTANPDVTFSPAQLVFTSSNNGWNTEQTVTVSSAEDDDSNDDTATITLSASGGASGANSYAGISQDVSVRVQDDDDPGLRFSRTQPIEVFEGSTDGFLLNVRLLTRPTSNVVLTLTSTGSPDVKFDTDFNQSGNQNSMVFTPSNWDSDQTIRITADNDEDSAQDTATITFDASGAEYANVQDSVTVNVKENTIDLRFVPVTRNVSVPEGDSRTYTAVLSVKPDENVGVALRQKNPSNPDVEFFPTHLLFTPSIWDTPQTITVTTEEDDDASDDMAFIEMETSGGGDDFRNVTRTVTISVPDPDEAGLVTTPQSLRVLEGVTTTFTVRLATDPIEDAMVLVEKPSNTDVIVYWPGKGSDDDDPNPMVFTSSNWDEPITVTVAVNPDDDAIDDDVEIILKSSGGEDQGSNSYAIDDTKVQMTVIDVDKPGLVLSQRRLEIEEGLDANFTVQLLTRPSGNVTVTLSQPTNPDVTIDVDIPTPGSQYQLTFEPDQWDTPLPVNISTVSDLDADDESEVISMMASGGGYDLVEVRGRMVPVEARVSVMVKDKNQPGSLVSTFGVGSSDSSGSMTLTEGDVVNFDVVLNVQPTENVSVNLTSDNPDVVFDPDRIVFTPSPADTGSTSSAMSDPTPHLPSASATASTTSMWNAPVTIQVSVMDDDDSFLETARIIIMASGGNYVNTRIIRHLNIKDDDRVDPGPGLARPGDPLTWEAKSYAFAIPPMTNGDQATVRLQCKEPSESCDAFFDCTAQNDSRTYRGLWSRSIPARGADTATLSDIAEIVNDSFERQGRLACIIRSEQNLVTQVWTRSGDGVLVNNSQLIHSDSNHEADIGTIPSPRTGDRSNIRIRCNKGGVKECTGTRLECAEDDGTVHVADIGAILRGIVRHVQTEELQDLLEHRWEGLGLSCTVLSDQAFTVQILTRTGGGGALVNNSAVSAR